MPTQHAHSEALSRIVCIPEPSVGDIKQRTAANADPGSQPSTLPLVLCKDPSWGWMLSLPFFYHDFQRLIFMCVLHLYPHACGYLLSLLCPHHGPTQPICGFPSPISWSLTRLMWLMKLHASLVMLLSVPFMYKDARAGPNPRESH